jgi:hypothetical protein
VTADDATPRCHVAVAARQVRDGFGRTILKNCYESPYIRGPVRVFTSVKYLFWTLRLALVVTLPLSGTGCSWLFSQPPPKGYRGSYVNCSTNRAPPVLDTIFTITNVASALYVAGQDNVVNKESSVALGLGVATLWALSAVYGYQSASECEEALEPWSSRYPSPAPRAMPPGYAPPRYAPPPPPPGPVPLAPTAPLPPPPAPNDQGYYVVPEAKPPAPPPAPQQIDEDAPGTRRKVAPSDQ